VRTPLVTVLLRLVGGLGIDADSGTPDDDFTKGSSTPASWAGVQPTRRNGWRLLEREEFVTVAGLTLAVFQRPSSSMIGCFAAFSHASPRSGSIHSCSIQAT
jgi:hypothetical protein